MDNTGPLPLAADTLHDLTKAEASRFYGGEAGDEPPQGGVYHGVQYRSDRATLSRLNI